MPSRCSTGLVLAIVLGGAATAALAQQQPPPIVIQLDPRTMQPYPDAAPPAREAQPKAAEPAPPPPAREAEPKAEAEPAPAPPAAVPAAAPAPVVEAEAAPAEGAAAEGQDAGPAAAEAEAATTQQGEAQPEGEAPEGEAAELAEDGEALRKELGDEVPAPTVAPDDPEFAKKYAEWMRPIVRAVRAKVLAKIEAKIIEKQEAGMGRISTALGLFSLAGVLLLFMPLFLMRRYPGKLGKLFGYSALAAVTFFVAVNLFATVILGLKSVQGALGSYTNPQVRIVTAAFDTVEEKADDLAPVGPALFEPTLGQLLGGESEEPMPILLLQNVQKLKNDFTVFTQIARFFKSINFVFGYLPTVLTLLALFLFILATRPILTQIIQMPARAASGEAGVARRVLKDTFLRIWRELLATLCLIAVLVAVTILAGAILSYVLKPAIEAFMAWLIVAMIYVQVDAQASATWILLSLGGTIFFLALNLAVIILSSGGFLGKTQKILQQRFQDKVPLRAHARFWKWGPLSLVFVQVFPLLYILGAKPLVELIIDKSSGGGEMPNWPLLLVSGPAVLVLLFAVVFWAARGLKALLFLMRYKVKGEATVVVHMAEQMAPAQVAQ